MLTLGATASKTRTLSDAGLFEAHVNGKLAIYPNLRSCPLPRFEPERAVEVIVLDIGFVVIEREAPENIAHFFTIDVPAVNLGCPSFD